MNIEALDIKTIELFALYYNFTSNYKFDKKNGLQNAKNQKKFKKWICKYYLNGDEFSNEIKMDLKNSSDSEFITFFKSCYDYIQSNGTALEQQINKDWKELSSDVKKSFLNLFEKEYYVKNDFIKTNNTIEIIVTSSAAYEERLILFNAEFSVENFDSIYFDDNYSFIKEDSKYKLTATGRLDDIDNEFNVTISFSSAKTKFQVFKPTNDFISVPPWEQLFNISTAIIDKQELNLQFNSLELELLPLLKEIVNLFLFNNDDKTFPIIKNLIKKYEYFELLLLLEKIECENFYITRRMAMASKLTHKLNFIKYKPLWQEIYNLICESQKEYPTKVETYNSKTAIAELKNKVTALMNEQGYFGEYPLFYKKTSVKGMHIIDSYKTSHLIPPHKNVIHYIMCEENCYAKNEIYLTFSYGTELLKQNEDINDYHSCRFNCKGKKFANYILFNTDFDDKESLSLEERIKLAVKCIEFKKLTKEESSKTFNAFCTVGEIFIAFLLIFLFAGFLFASLFIPVMIVISALILWLRGIPINISDIPWLALYFGTWALFGGLTGIVTLFFKKR